MKSIRVMLLLIGAFSLSACGGGDAGDVTAPGPVVSISTFGIANAARSFLATPATHVASRFFDPFTTSVNVNIEPDTPVTIAALSTQPVSRALFYEVWYSTASPAPRRINRHYFHYSPAPFTYRARTTDAQDAPTALTTTTALPETATVGQSGALFTQVDAGFPMSATWSLEADTASTAWFCQTFTQPAVAGGTGSEKYCLKISASGALLGFKVDVSEAGSVTEFR